MDLLAFPENVLACILQSLPTEQLLNISRVPFTPARTFQWESTLPLVALQSCVTWCNCPIMRFCKQEHLLKVCCLDHIDRRLLIALSRSAQVSQQVCAKALRHV